MLSENGLFFEVNFINNNDENEDQGGSPAALLDVWKVLEFNPLKMVI